MALLSTEKSADRRRKELIVGVIALSVIFVALVIVAVVLFRGQTPRQAAKPAIDPVPTLPPLATNPYAAEDYLFNGEVMTLADGQGIPGIDVSKHQGEIDWQQVADSGVRFVILRIGNRGWGKEGVIVSDPYAQANYEGAKAAGLKVGVYFYAQATNLYEALEEAQWVMNALQGWEIDLPVVYDWEESQRTHDVSGSQYTAFARVFRRVLLENGYETMIYFNRHQALNRLQLHRLQDIPHWFAMYADAMTYPYDFAIWQYSDSGTVPGIDGKVDLDLLLPGQSFWPEE